jgi:alanyl-tRNA synthetase
MIEVVISTMSHVYPELTDRRNSISDIVKMEEEGFITTLDTGLTLAEKFADEASAQGREGLTGEEVFRLYDTHAWLSPRANRRDCPRKRAIHRLGRVPG